MKLFDSKVCKREYVFTYCSGHLEIVVTANKDHSLISLYRLLGFQRYRREELSVRLPSQRDIAIGRNPNVGEQSIYAKAVWGARRTYHPTKEPDSPEIQKVFARLLKDALCTLIDVVSRLA